MGQPSDPNQPPQYGAPPPPPYGAPAQPYGAPAQPYGAPAQPYGSAPGTPSPGYGAPGYGYGPPPGQRVNDPAPMGMRLLARIIDGILVSVVATAIAYAFGSHPFDFSSDNGTASGSFSLYGSDFWKFAAIQLIVSGLYEVTMLTKRGATLGKMAVNVRVAKIEDGSTPDVQSAFIRWAIPSVTQSVIPFIGWIIDLSPFFDSTHRNRGWYDLAAKTIAVRTK